MPRGSRMKIVDFLAVWVGYWIARIPPASRVLQVPVAGAGTPTHKRKDR